MFSFREIKTKRIINKEVEQATLNDSAEVIVKKHLLLKKEMGFEELVSVTKLSRASVNKALQKLFSKGTVAKGNGLHGKWRLTNEGCVQITTEGLANAIRTCTVLGVQTESTPTTQTYLAYEVIKSDEKANLPKKYPNSANPYKGNNFTMAELDIAHSLKSRVLETHCLDLTPDDVKKIAFVEELKTPRGEDAKEKVLEALSKRVKKIVFVEVLYPALLLEERRTAKDGFKEADICPECGSTSFVHDSDVKETICGNCGLVLRVDA
ncbi:MAG: hypothetical protein NWF05_11865 [Candidatus Bathyarchaeota archaeon]|nr:hypothetical protein [Candidatus Bathyarchaeota archaeon]